MVDLDAHVNQWKHNRVFIEKVPPAFPDWVVTASFYTAVHAVNALLAHDRVPRVHSHQARNDVLQRTNRYRQVEVKYQPLYALSRTVRYFADPQGWIPPERIEADVLRRFLYPLEKSVQKLIGLDLSLSAVQLQLRSNGS